MKTRTIVIIIIIMIIAVLIYKNIQESSRIVSTNVLNVVQEELKKKINFLDINSYPSSAIWKVGETLKLGDYKQSENGLYKIKVENVVINGYKIVNLNSFNPKFNDIPEFAKNPMPAASDMGDAIFTLQHDGIHSNTSVIGIDANTLYDKNQPIILANLPNKNYDTYNSYDINGEFLGPIKAPQGLVNIKNYHQNFHAVKNIDHIIFDNTGVFGVDNSNNVIFVDLW